MNLGTQVRNNNSVISDHLEGSSFPSLTRRTFLSNATLGIGFLAFFQQEGLGAELRRPQETPLASVVLRGIEIKRGKLNYRGGPSLIVLHKDENIWPSKLLTHDSLDDLLRHDRSRPGYIVAGNGQEWFQEANGPKFNCHAFALGQRLGLKATDWVEGMSSPLTERTNPMKEALRVYFVKKFDQARSDPVFARITKSSQLREGDIVAFYDSKTHSYVHSGVVRKRNGENWYMCKLGEQRVVCVPFSAADSEYGRLYDRVQIFRFK